MQKKRFAIKTKTRKISSHGYLATHFNSLNCGLGNDTMYSEFSELHCKKKYNYVWNILNNYHTVNM